MLHNRKMENGHLIKTFGRNQYSLLSLFPILSVLTALLGFYVAQKGWGSTGQHLRGYFLLFTALTTLVGVFPGVYNLKESLNVNVNSFNELTKLENKIFHYSFTAPYLYQDSIGSARTLIDKINKEELAIPSVKFTINKVDPSSSLTKSIGVGN